ncbi:hypothetical protein PENTCL1PPCAC_21672, partial [Pristionchus entomophagus]
GEEFSVERDIVRMSGTIADMLASFPSVADDDSASSSQPIPLPNVTANSLKLVLKWCEEHKKDEKEEKKDDDDNRERNQKIPEWDEKFFKPMDQKTLCDLFMAANFLNIQGLFDHIAKCIAKKITGKSTKEIRDEWNIVNDFTPEEEEAIRKKN